MKNTFFHRHNYNVTSQCSFLYSLSTLNVSIKTNYLLLLIHYSGISHERLRLAGYLYIRSFGGKTPISYFLSILNAKFECPEKALVESL